jgi:hypothetical protein
MYAHCINSLAIIRVYNIFRLSREKDDDRNPYKTEKDVKDHALARWVAKV